MEMIANEISWWYYIARYAFLTWNNDRWLKTRTIQTQHTTDPHNVRIFNEKYTKTNHSPLFTFGRNKGNYYIEYKALLSRFVMKFPHMRIPSCICTTKWLSDTFQKWQHTWFAHVSLIAYLTLIRFLSSCNDDEYVYLFYIFRNHNKMWSYK